MSQTAQSFFRLEDRLSDWLLDESFLSDPFDPDGRDLIEQLPEFSGRPLFGHLDLGLIGIVRGCASVLWTIPG